MGKKTAETKLLDQDIADIESKFYLEELKMKGNEWTCKLVVSTVLSQTQHLYDMTLVFDESPFTERIKDLEARSRGSLFSGTADDNRELREHVDEITADMKKLKRECNTIEMSVIVKEVKYKDTRTTSLTLLIKDTVIADLNCQKELLKYYKLVMKPVYV